MLSFPLSNIVYELSQEMNVARGSHLNVKAKLIISI